MSDVVEASPVTRPHFTETGGWKTYAAIASGFSLISDFLKPIAPWLTPALLGISIAVVLYALLRKKHRGATAYAAVATAFVVVIVVAQLFSGNRVGPNPGIVGRLAPQVTTVQAAILPLGRTQSTLLQLGADMRSGNISTREDAADRALSLADPAARRTAMDALLTSGDPHLRALALREAMKLKQGHALPIVIGPDVKRGPLALALSGVDAIVTNVDPTGSAFEGNLGNGGVRFDMHGSVSSDAVTMSSLISVGASNAQRFGITLHFILTGEGGLLGVADCGDGETVPVSLPLL